MSVQIELVFSSITARPEAVHADIVFRYADGSRQVIHVMTQRILHRLGC